ncbi:hypothetical protein [Pinibacter soli]|uniref:Uncharacterized protein n=1 Tax=Pinibacter soli TaxID=3044211 RepID=A0ABT6REC9_9BACT|nr:hypothetical protein [Pinibacter soli]MDI3320933.1 hypothetical protein [Pinibacter soli]
MAINKNHEFDDLQGVKCAIVEKNVLQERADFLKTLLETNGYTVIVAPAPPPKAAPTAAEEGSPATPVSFIVGVTDVTFSAVLAVFGRQLRTKDGHVVSLAYWQQKEAVSNDEVPYYEKSST